MNIVNTKIYYGIFAIASLVLDLSTSWSASLRDRQQLTQEPVEGARKEDEVVVWGAGALGSEGSKYTETFEARFGLKLRFNYDMAGNTGEKISRAVVKTQTGLPRTYDDGPV